jgi:hypothetical protein
MGRVHRFEDLVAWQKGKDLVVAVYRTTQRGGLSKGFWGPVASSAPSSILLHPGAGRKHEAQSERG